MREKRLYSGLMFDMCALTYLMMQSVSQFRVGWNGRTALVAVVSTRSFLFYPHRYVYCTCHT